MNLNRLIVHEILKEPKSKEAKIIKSESLLPIDDLAKNLIEALLKAYRSDNTILGQFNYEVQGAFPDRYKTYITSTKNDQSFIDFTKFTSGGLLSKIRDSFLAKGGYLLFSEYTDSENNFIGVFFIRDVTRQILSRIENSFKIQDTDSLDTDNLAMACTINEDRLLSGEDNYLTFTSKKQKYISDYFLHWLWAKELTSSKENTNRLKDVINNIERPINPETNSPYTIEEFYEVVVDYAKKSPHKKINLLSLSEQLYGDKLKIVTYANENNINIGSDFRYHERHIKKWTNIDIKKDGITLKVSRGDVKRGKIKFADDPKIVIIESKEFADSLRKELEP